jgi:hypothetical protein
VVPRLVEMPKRKLPDGEEGPLHTTSKDALVKALVEHYRKQIDEACFKAPMPEWSRDVISGRVIQDPIVLPCEHRFHRENLICKMIMADPLEPITEQCPVSGCTQYVDLETVQKSSSLALKREIQLEEKLRHDAYMHRHEQLLRKMQQDIEDGLKRAMHETMLRGQ